MKIKIYLFIIFLSINICNDLDKEINKILNSNYVTNQYTFSKLNEKYSESDDISILKGLNEIDGKTAFEYFSDYITKNPNGEYAELAIIKIGEYYYSKGLYLTSSKWYKKIPMHYPQSHKLETSISYFLNSLVISGKSDSARYYANYFQNLYPNNKLLNKSFINDNNKQEKVFYSIKVGTYDKLNTALYYKNILLKEKFSTVIRETDIFYELLVGKYKNKKLAENDKKRLLSRLGFTGCEIIIIE